MARPPRDTRDTRDRGTVTAETALALPALVVVFAALLGGGRLVLAELSCVDAARAGARAAARAEPDARVVRVASDLAPAGAPVTVRREGGLVRVGVAAAVRVPLPVPPIPVRCEAVAAAEASFAEPSALAGSAPEGP